MTVKKEEKKEETKIVCKDVTLNIPVADANPEIPRGSRALHLNLGAAQAGMLDRVTAGCIAGEVKLKAGHKVVDPPMAIQHILEQLIK
jgi:hypothetical protein